jgi:hypothetical protein
VKGIRLVGVIIVLLLLLGSGIALAEQTEGEAQEAASPSLEAESLPDRTANSETLALPDGQLETRIYPAPVNYRDEEGNWQPIGERLLETGEQTLTNGPNAFDVTLPKQIDTKPLRFEVGDQWVESQLLRKDLEGADLEGAIATYEGEGNAPSFEFTGLSNGLKEEIELTGPGQANRFTYELSASDDLTPFLADDGSIRFLDSEGTAVVVLPAPVMSDSAPQPVVSRAVHYELGPEEDGHWKLSVVADREWLDDPARAWPVRIDPTMTIGPALDCVIGGKKGETGWIDCAAWGRKDLLIGYTPKLNSAEDGWWRTLMEFDMTGVPVNSEVTSATFNIRSLETALNTKGVELRKTTKPWTWKASWSRYDGAENLWTTEGGDWAESLGEVLTATRGTQIGWWQFNMPASLVEKEVNAEEWMGTILKLLDDKVRECTASSCTQRQVKFDSSAATTVAQPPLHLRRLQSTGADRHDRSRDRRRRNRRHPQRPGQSPRLRDHLPVRIRHDDFLRDQSAHHGGKRRLRQNERGGEQSHQRPERQHDLPLPPLGHQRLRDNRWLGQSLHDAETSNRNHRNPPLHRHYRSDPAGQRQSKRLKHDVSIRIRADHGLRTKTAFEPGLGRLGNHGDQYLPRTQRSHRGRDLSLSGRRDQRGRDRGRLRQSLHDAGPSRDDDLIADADLHFRGGAAAGAIQCRPIRRDLSMLSG